MIVAALAFLTASVAAQANFAGKWTLGSGLRVRPRRLTVVVDVAAAAAACSARN